jgi:hypothetical protein
LVPFVPFGLVGSARVPSGSFPRLLTLLLLTMEKNEFVNLFQLRFT